MRVPPPNLPNFRSDGLSAPLLQGGRLLVYVIWRLKLPDDPAVTEPSPLAREYVTKDIFGGMTFARGRAVDSVSLGNPEVGNCRFTLLNLNGKYSPANTKIGNDNPLYRVTGRGGEVLSRVAIGRLIKVVYFPEGATSSSQGSTLWTGIVTSLRPRMENYHMPVVDVVCSGPLWLFGDRQLDIKESGTKTTLELAKGIVEAPAFDFTKGLGKVSSDSNWGTDVVDWQPGSGSGLSHLGSLEILEATFNILENKDGSITFWNGANHDFRNAKMILLDRHPTPDDNLTAWQTEHTHLIGDMYQPSNEELIYSCFEWDVQTSTVPVNYPSDVQAGGVVIHIWADTIPPSFRIDYGQTQRVEMDVGIEGDFTNMGLLPDRTRVTFVKSNANNDETDLAPPIIGTPASLPTFIQSIQVQANPNAPESKVILDITRTDSEQTTHYWIQKIELFGIRKYLPDGVTKVRACIERKATENYYGKREFPYTPTFFSHNEANKWGNKMAARYGDSEYRFTVSVIPKNETEMSRLADLDVHEAVLAHFHKNSGVFMPLGDYVGWQLSHSWRTMIVERIECTVDEDKHSVWQLDLIDWHFYQVIEWPDAGFLLDNNSTDPLGTV